jgi:hypothetical protein
MLGGAPSAREAKTLIWTHTVHLDSPLYFVFLIRFVLASIATRETFSSCWRAISLESLELAVAGTHDRQYNRGRNLRDEETQLNPSILGELLGGTACRLVM